MKKYRRYKPENYYVNDDFFSAPIITIYEKDNIGARRNDAAIATIPEIVTTSVAVFFIFLAIICFPNFFMITFLCLRLL